MAMNGFIYMCVGIGLCSALVAGTFQAFSEFVMKALIAAQPTAGIETMQIINRTVYKTVFLVLLLGLMPVTAGFAIYVYLGLPNPAKVWVVSGAAIYFIFVFAVTMLANVPMNNRLDSMRFNSDDTIHYWRIYGKRWTGWNHVRTLGSIATSICFLIASV